MEPSPLASSSSGLPSPSTGEDYYTPLEEIAGKYHRLQHGFASGKTRPREYRISQLQALKAMLIENKTEFSDALYQDLRRDSFLTEVAEIASVIQEIDLAATKLDEWMAGDTSISVPLVHKPGKAFVMREPLGVVLIIAPFNYPLRLLLLPLIGAIAAGNAALLKPSEISGQTARAFNRILPKYLDRDSFSVVAGAVSQTTELLRLRWDFIFYTGAPMVGKIVMEAAAKHLTPVCLELGGKSPVYVSETCDLPVTVRRILSGKYSNSGQTCVAPDYVLVHPAVEKRVLEEMRATLLEWFGADPQKSADFGRVVSARHLNRLSTALAESLRGPAAGVLFHGGRVDAQDLYMAPTIVTNPSLGSPLMTEEIFGPILPVITCRGGVAEFIKVVNSRAKPLALYVFSSSQQEIDTILAQTSSGGVCINDTVMQVAIADLPFGGVGNAGFGAYNGKHTFELFSHHKSVLHRKTWLDSDIRYPPFTDSKKSLTLRLLNFQLPSLPSLSATAGVVVSSYLGYQLYLRRQNVLPAWQRLNSKL